jgi:hypothetical protein
MFHCPVRLILCMKKLLLLSVILVGAASASQAGVNLNFGFGFPLPTPPGLSFSHSARVVTPRYVPAPVYVAPPICEETEVIVTPPVCEPRVEIRSDRYPGHYRTYDRDRHFSNARDNRGHWDRDQHSGYRR